jgi:hypothetical protein
MQDDRSVGPGLTPFVFSAGRRHALQEAEKADPANIERGVVQFKQTLKARCDDDEGPTLEARTRNSDKAELEHFVIEYAELCNLQADGLQQHTAKERYGVHNWLVGTCCMTASSLRVFTLA